MTQAPSTVQTAEYAEHPAIKHFRFGGPGNPHIWCEGCGIGQVWYYTVVAIEELGLDPDTVVWVGGSGCTGRMCTYWKYDYMHTLHGRPLGFATGIKLANPDLTVICHMGDGETSAIGGNHLIQTARRNVDITAICVNNFTYGMTGGQVSPTTHHYARTPTTPYGNTEYPFNLPWLVAAAGAVYVARWTTAHIRQLAKAMKQAIAKRGFSFVEVVAACPTNYGRRNKLGDGRAAMREFRDNSVIKQSPPLEDLSMSLGEQIIAGAFVDKERPTFDDELAALTPKEGAATQ